MIWMGSSIFVLFAIVVYLLYVKCKELADIKAGNYPAHITLDKDNQLEFSIFLNSKLGKPRLIYIFEENKEDPSKSTLMPIRCNDKEEYDCYVDFFKTCADVWRWENQEFNKYRAFVEKYIENKDS